MFCYCFILYGQNNDSINAIQIEKIEKILADREYKFNVYNLVKNERIRSDNNQYDPETFELIDLTVKKNNFQGDSRENELPTFEIKKIDSLVPYKFISKDSIITLTSENENYPNFNININSNQLKLMESGHILNFEKEIIVEDNINILKSGWTGVAWSKDIYINGIKYRHSVTIGRTYDSNKIYFNIKTFSNTKKVNLILISVN